MTMIQSDQTLLIEKLKKETKKLTPMMEQYYQIKLQHKENILFFRMGDFYEVFFEDAQKTSKILNIALTHRGKIGETPIPMAGIPHHAASTYIDKITQAGERVAICEQMENPKEAKGVVKRGVAQVVSPGIPYDLEKSEETRSHYLFSFKKRETDYYLAFLDFTTGEFFGRTAPSESELIDIIRSYSPKECISYFDQFENSPEVLKTLEGIKTLTTYLSDEYFQEKFTAPYIEKIIPQYKKDQTLKKEQDYLSPVGALSYYLSSTQAENPFNHIRPFKIINTLKTMKVSYQTLSSLEIFPRSQETYSHSLLAFIDKTKSSMGKRKLKEVALNPFNDRELIEKRHNFIDELLKDIPTLEEIRKLLSDLRDIPRILAKSSTGKIQGHDLINLSNGLKIFSQLKKLLSEFSQPFTLNCSPQDLKKLAQLKKLINDAINPELGASLSKGNLIKEGYSEERDRFANMNGKVEARLAKLQTKYREEYEIPTLRLKSNNINGYFIEVSKGQASKVPPEFKKKQTLTNSERFTSTELDKIENDLLQASEKLLKIEREIFNGITAEVLVLNQELHEVSHWLGLIDVLQSFSWLAYQLDFVRPEITAGKESKIQGAWHPLIKSIIKDSFVAHDIELNDDSFFALITGPNMAGKTTVMREVAIIHYLSQLGSFVPALSAKVGLCDYIFSRIGASDDIVGGQSTFMVEMSETSEIIRHASSSSLVILDEIGRGTSTYDGLSLAWSLLEHFVNQIKCRTLFSTHYHELIEVVDQIEGAKNFTVKTLNKAGEIQFLYELIAGGAKQSFGLNVAKLAGIPAPILSRAKEILGHLETKENTNSPMGQLSFFNETDQESEIEKKEDPLAEFLKGINPDNLTPRKALQKIYELKDIQTH